MKHFFLICFAALFCFSLTSFSQIPTTTLVQIAKAEDERRYDATLENLLKNSDEKVRIRAALAAGRIGDEKAIPMLTQLFQTDASNEVRTMAIFALGEIESAKATTAIIEVLKNQNATKEVRARALEAAGKIAAANPKDDKTKELSETLLKTLDNEDKKREGTNREVSLMGITAILRARPANSEKVLIDFLGYSDARMRADALNALARLRAKNANEEARELLRKDADPIVRANAARVLSAAEDKGAFELLLKAAIDDTDSRVRVSAIRALANLKDARAADKLLVRSTSIPKPTTNGTGCQLAASKNLNNNPLALLECDFDLKSEMLEIATALGRLLPNTNNQNAINFLTKFREFDKYQSPETEIAYARIAPEKYISEFKSKNDGYGDWRIASSYGQGLGDIGSSQDAALKARAGQTLTDYVASLGSKVKPRYQSQMIKAIPDLMRSLAALKPDNLTDILRSMLENPDVQIRATAAGLLANQPMTKENVEALKTAFNKALITDKRENDAQLATLDALYKLNKKESVGIFSIAMSSPDYLVRKKAFEILSDKDLQKDFPGIQPGLEMDLAKKKNQILSYASYTGTKLGQILNTNIDYTRALSRKNGTVKAVLTTSKGSFTIDFYPEEAPLTVDNFVKLARSGYYNNLSIHRVVPNFVMQDGDPRGDGNGGPGWQIRCEVNMLAYERGAVGMALSGKDTGGSQWFVTHSPQPHLDGGYTVFGKVNETDMKVVDNLVRGDKILSVRIIENGVSRPTVRGKR